MKPSVPSRLRLAWAVFAVALLALAAAAVLAPPPEAARQEVALDLPASPDILALPQAEGREAAMERTARLPAALRENAAPEADHAAADEIPEGALVITIADGGEAEGQAGPQIRAPAPPDPALITTTADGERPARGADGRTPFEAYRRQRMAEGEAGVAVVLGGLGLDAAATRRAIALPADISLAFAPYAKDLPALMTEARKAGHEVLIELPMGTPGVAPAALGPAALLEDRAEAGNARRLDWLLSRAPAYAMATNYLGRGFSQSSSGMSLVMAKLAEAGLGYVDDTGLGEDEAAAAGVPYIRTDRVIAAEDGPILPQLDDFAATAQTGRVAVAKLYLSAEALTALELWADDLPDGVMLHPASGAARQP